MQEPIADIHGNNDGNPSRLLDQYDADPWDNYEKNLRESNKQLSRDRRECGKVVRPFGQYKEGVELLNQDGKLKQRSKVFHPGYSYVSPDKWDIPQQRPPQCIPDKWNRPSAVFDRGTPLNVLELDENGEMLMDENQVTFTNVGSILPKFEYREIHNY